MNRIFTLLGLICVLGGMPCAIGQDFCDVSPCAPSLILPHQRDRSGFFDSPFSFSGWVEAGVYSNDTESQSNGPLAAASHQRTDFVMNQLYLIGEKTMDTSRGFDWGARTDLVYGGDAAGMQCADGTFDFDWGTNRHDYAMAAYQLYGTIGYKDMSIKIGKFITPIGWEGTASKDNFFYSHSYCYWIEPATHTGVLGTFNMTDRLTVNAGWVTGENSSFDNPGDNSAVLAGFTFSLTDNTSIIYWLNGGNREHENIDYFFQSLCFQWDVTDRFTYVFQYDLRNESVKFGPRTSAYGINNHFLYKLTDQWSAGARVEWLRNDNCLAGVETGDYWEITLGLNWKPYENVSIRPDVRYDWCRGGALPYGDGSQNNQVSGGFGVLVSF